MWKNYEIIPCHSHLESKKLKKGKYHTGFTLNDTFLLGHGQKIYAVEHGPSSKPLKETFSRDE